MKFYLGTHQPHWLKDERFAHVPLFISRRTLNKLRTPPRACTSFALDSGGFTELQMYGRWTLTAEQYAAEVWRYVHAYGQRLEWVAPQDWMCEPLVLAGGKASRGIGVCMAVLAVAVFPKNRLPGWRVTCAGIIKKFPWMSERSIWRDLAERHRQRMEAITGRNLHRIPFRRIAEDLPGVVRRLAAWLPGDGDPVSLAADLSLENQKHRTKKTRARQLPMDSWTLLLPRHFREDT